MNVTTLSDFVLENDLNPDPDIESTIIRTADPFRPGIGSCQLCVGEKFHINEQSGNPDDLNKRTDVGQTCRHKARYKLALTITKSSVLMSATTQETRSKH